MVDPFTFATNSEQWGSASSDRGKYPVKLYNSSSVLIYQVDNGATNSGKLPSGGVLHSSTDASSMNDAVANPMVIFGSWETTVIAQSGQSSDLYNYYCTSYSRGTDGKGYPTSDPNPNWHNDYLDSYIPSRHKSIYDPCPYGYRIPSNGTYNEFNSNPGWTQHSYIGGAIWNQSWVSALGNRNGVMFFNTGYMGYYSTGTASLANSGYLMTLLQEKIIQQNRNDYSRNAAVSIRCIEDCSVVSDATEASAGY